jgi:transcriptional regulator with GAF, ATPase, and Fis domain
MKNMNYKEKMKKGQDKSVAFGAGPSGHLLSLAALFEDHFSIDWLVTLLKQKPSQILFALEEAISQGYLSRKTVGIYAFSDLESRKKWQSNLSLKEQVLLHKEIASVIIKAIPDNQDNLLCLPYHLMHISNDVQGCHWLITAAEKYMETYQTEKAIQCYEKVLSDLSNLEGEEVNSLFSKAAIAYSKFGMGRHNTQKVLSVVREGLASSKKCDRKDYEALLEMQLARIQWLRSEFSLALTHFEAGWTIVKQLQNPGLLRSAAIFSSFFLYWQGRFREAIKSYEGTVPDVEDLPAAGFPFMSTFTLGVCYAKCGQISQGLGMFDALRSLFAERKDHYRMAFVLSAMGQIMLEIRRMEDAIGYLEMAISEAAQGNNSWVKILAKLMLTLAFCLKGENSKAQSSLYEFFQDSKKVGLNFPTFPYLMAILWHLQESELPTISEYSITSELQRMIMSENICIRGIAYRYRSVLLRQEGQPHKKVIQNLNRSIELLEESGAIVELARSQFELAREYFFRDDESTGGAVLVKASQTVSCLGTFGDALFPDDLKSLVSESGEGDNLLKEILKIGQEIVTMRDTKQLLSHIISTVNRITGAERGAIFLIDGHENQTNIRLRGAKNLSYEQVASSDFDTSRELINQVALSGKGCLADPSTSKPIELNKHHDVRSRICVPMIIGDKVVGLLYHDNRLLKNAFKEADLELLGYFAALAAIALDNAASYEEIRRLNHKLKEEKSYYEEQQLQVFNSDGIIVESLDMRHVLSQVDKVAPTDSAVLILGESGVGKELIAQAIHRQSKRKSKPFIRVNCSVLSETLIQSELFGHERGAFTGAIQRRIGRFELADGGTLFLDEIGEIPEQIQIRLLNVLQTKEFERLGGSEVVRSDFRLLAATNRDLEKDVKEGRFRLDLYYRLNVFPIYIPPLRERKEDIPLLCHFFVRKIGTRMDKKFHKISNREIEKLIRYDWPGNVRELENIIERGVIISSGSYFKIPELAISESDVVAPRNSNMTLKDIERLHILSTLEKTRWKVRGPGGAAELLGINSSTLTSRMKKLGIHRPKDIPKMRASRSDLVLKDSLH